MFGIMKKLEKKVFQYWIWLKLRINWILDTFSIVFWTLKFIDKIGFIDLKIEIFQILFNNNVYC